MELRAVSRSVYRVSRSAFHVVRRRENGFAYYGKNHYICGKFENYVRIEIPDRHTDLL